MSYDDFRRNGYRIIDWIADYMERGYDGPVMPDVKPGDLLERLPAGPPGRPEPLSRVVDDFEDLILPGITHWNDPRFFAYFPCNHSGPSILGELLAAGLDVNAMSWATSPAATELEIRMMQWLGQLIGLSWPGVIQDTASTATLCALLSARERKAAVNRTGYYAHRPLTVYTSAHAHSSLTKAVWISGIGEEYLRLIPGDAEYAMDPKALAQAIEADLAEHRVPCMVMSTVGTTSSTAIDPVPAISRICVDHSVWHHVDAALAGTAAILPEMRWLMDGVAEADSYCFNPHKWMFTNLDCSAYFCREPEYLKAALAIQPEYLKTARDEAVENFRDWNIQLGRRFRALKLWLVMRAYGVEGLQEKIRLHLRMATWFADQVERHPALALLARPRLNTVCFTASDDVKTEALMKDINASGQAYLSHTRLDDRYVIRVSFGQTHSRFEHAERLWQTIEERI